MPRPPMQQTAAVGVPTAGGTQALEKAVRLTARRLRAQFPGAYCQRGQQRSKQIGSHEILSLPRPTAY
jgi:hypothetical protein